jgi:hypothetical protein
MKRLLKALFVSALAGSAVVSASDDANSSELQALKAEIAELETILDTQESSVTSLDGVLRDARLLHAAHGQANQQGAITLANSHSLTLSSDFRTRWARTKVSTRGGGDMTNDAFQARLRLDLDFKITEDLSVNVRLAGAGNAITDTNYTYGSGGAFSKDAVQFERVSASYHPNEHFTLILGQQAHPMYSTTQLMDPDINQAGATVKVKAGQEALGAFATAGVYKLMPVVGRTAHWAGLQAGVAPELDNMDLVVAIGYHTAVRTGAVADPKWEFRQGDIYASIATDLEDVNLRVFGQYAKNWGADGAARMVAGSEKALRPRDESAAWVAGVEGTFQVMDTNAITAHYSYARIEADATVGAFVDNEFSVAGQATDVRGHRFGLAYAVSQNMSVGVTSTMTKRISKVAAGTAEKQDLWFVDVSYNF